MRTRRKYHRRRYQKRRRFSYGSKLRRTRAATFSADNTAAFPYDSYYKKKEEYHPKYRAKQQNKLLYKTQKKQLQRDWDRTAASFDNYHRNATNAQEGYQQLSTETPPPGMSLTEWVKQPGYLSSARDAITPYVDTITPYVGSAANYAYEAPFRVARAKADAYQDFLLQSAVTGAMAGNPLALGYAAPALLRYGGNQALEGLWMGQRFLQNYLNRPPAQDGLGMAYNVFDAAVNAYSPRVPDAPPRRN